MPQIQTAFVVFSGNYEASFRTNVFATSFIQNENTMVRESYLCFQLVKRSFHLSLQHNFLLRLHCSHLVAIQITKCM